MGEETLKRKICFVTAVELTVKAFLLDQIAALGITCDVSVIANTQNAFFLKELGLEASVIPAGIERKISPWNDVKALFQLWRIFREKKFYSVHSVTPKAGLLAMTAGRLSGVPVRVHTFTGQVWATKVGFTRWFLKKMDKMTALCATHVLADSFSQKDFIVAQGIVPEEKIQVLAKGSISGVDTECFFPDAKARKRVRSEFGIPDNSLVFLFLGRLTRDKGVLDLAEAFVRVCEEMSNACLLVAGGDEENLQPRIEALCHSCADKIHFVGFVPTVAPYMCASDVFCLPSYREGFGSVVLEAAACGIPAMGSRVYGISDAIVEGETGLLHEAGNVEDIFQCLRKFSVDENMRKTMGEKAMKRVHEGFSKSTVTRAVLSFYRKQLS